jgi:PAS domain S-box-containing protein
MIGNPERPSASILMAPLPYGGDVIGVVSAQSYTLNAYTRDDLDFLQGTASQIAIAVQNARLYDSLKSELSERRRSEAALRQSEARLRAIIENIPYDLWMCDNSGRYVMQSSVSRRIAGDVTGKLPEELNFPPEVLRVWSSIHSRALDGQIVLEETGYRVNGEEHNFLTMLAPIRETESLVGFVGMNVDITDLKRSEEALRQYAERIAILHQIDQAILEVRSPQEIAMAALSRLPDLMPCTTASLALLDVNAGVAQVVAIYSHGNTLPGSGEMVAFHDPPRLQQLMAGEVVYITDLVTQPIDGPPSLNRVLLQGPIHAVIAVPLSHQEQLIGVLSVGAEKRGQLSPEDVKVITEIATQLAISIHQSQLVTEVQQLNTELEQRVQQRTAELEAAYKELEAFSYSVSHDLRAPLRGVMGYLRLFIEDCSEGLDADAQDYLRRIQDSAQRMNLLIDDLLSLSRVSRKSLERAQFSLHALFREVLDELMVGRDAARIQVSLHPMPVVEADRSLLRQVVQNLLENALKYSRSQPVARLEIGSLEKDHQPVFFVKDNGVGFDMQFADRLFSPFQRLHNQDEFEGTGIGLAIVHRILQRHGGRIWAEAAPGQGAAFYFTLDGGV